MSDTDWNPRFVEYARTNGRLPEAQCEHDRDHWPGGIMTGFVLWTSQRWAEWRALRGRKPDDILSNEDHLDFDTWLKSK